MFSRPHHQKIAHILRLLDGQVLREKQCYFGEGTAIALRFGEYRESVDLDFMVSDQESYRQLREGARNSGLQFLLRAGATEQLQHSDIRIDRHGIRTRILFQEQWIKFEIVHEGRICLDQPSDDDQICGISCLSISDMFCSKLLANSDHWSDRGVFSRDLIDLAMIQASPSALIEAAAKAEGAYGQCVKDDVNKAVELLRQDREYFDRCLQVLAIEMPKAMLWKRIRALSKLR